MVPAVCISFWSMNRSANNRPKHKAMLLVSRTRQRRLSDEEQDLWTKITSGIEPLANRHSHHPAPPPKLEQSFVSERKIIAAPALSSLPPSPPRLPEITPGTTAGLDKNTAKRLRRGQMDIEASLDLHGMTQEAALNALSSFVETSFQRGRRCVRVVTGKGLRGEGVLRGAVPRWLNAMSLRPMVLSFTHALPKDGGEGALYILLRRRR